MLPLLFLGTPVNFDLQGSKLGTGLRAATFLGHMEMVSLLLEFEANVDANGGCWESVLEAARRSSASASASALVRVKGGNVESLGEPWRRGRAGCHVLQG